MDDALCPAGAATGAEVVLPMRIGARTLWRLRRRLVRVPLGLRQVLAGDLPDLPPLEPGGHGYLVSSLPASRLEDLIRRCSGFRPFVRQRYRRSYASLRGGFDSWLDGLSAKSRSTLRRKVRRFADRSGGTMDMRTYRTPGEMDSFHRDARAVSALTYQERRLGSGLPKGEAALAAMRSLAACDRVRGWILFLDGRPVSYLYTPAEEDTLIYSQLGYDPAFAELSPGTVLQFEALRQLMEEGRFAWFDFTEGEGQHKRQFATGAADCVDLLLLRPGLPNALTGRALTAFDGGVAAARSLVGRLGLERLARRLRR